MLKSIDWQAKEITLDSQGVSENAYQPGLSGVTEEALELTTKLIETFPEIFEGPFPGISSWNLIGITEANGSNYLESTISISPEGRVPEGLLEYLGIPLGEEDLPPHTSYTLKFQLVSHRVVLKLYEILTPRNCSLVLPEGCEIGVELGRHLNDDRLSHFRDLYFYSELPQKDLEDKLGVPVPSYGDEGKVYGCLYDVRDNRIVKVKQYLFPNKNPRDDLDKATDHPLTKKALNHGTYTAG